MIFALGLKQLGQTQSPGEKKGEPEERGSHFGNFLRGRIERKMKHKEEQDAKKEHRQQRVAAAHFQEQIFPKKQISLV
jgi:hypothetical protein